MRQIFGGDTMATQLTQINFDNSFPARQQRLKKALQSAHLSGIVLNPCPSLTYLTGLHFHLSERPVVALFTADQPPVIVLPELESLKTSQLSFPSSVFTYSEDPTNWVGAFSQGLKSVNDKNQMIGIEPRQMRVLEMDLLQKAAPHAHFKNAEDTIAALRMIKDETEADRMRKAVHIAQDALISTLKSFHLGITERELAAELTMQLLRHGSDPQFPFSPIVSSGPNSANPHASPSDRSIVTGDLLVIDWGASYHGYVSDLTRTFAIGEVDPEFKKIASLVHQANEAGRQACVPGAMAEAVDRAARNVIENAGYGAHFFHRTGHGIGMEGHEDPYIRAGNLQVLEPGMTFTVEPGIYLPIRNGVRVEDNVMITADGVETFSDLPRELTILPQG
jgi:Xaa-Pro dipeptidase